MIENKMYPLLPLQIFKLRYELNQIARNKGENKEERLQEVILKAKDTVWKIGIEAEELYNKQEIKGDGVKQPKEARKMPGVKKMHQESENSSKPEYIFGHLFGGIGVLAGNSKKLFCIPLSLKIHDGIKLIRSWDKNETEKGSHVVEIIRDGFDATKIFGKSLLVLDRYFLSVPALKTLENLNEEKNDKMHILTKAKIKKICKKRCLDPIEKITSESDKKLILAAVKAIEGYVMISNIAIGLLQILSLKFSGKITNSKFPLRFLRTQTNEFHSEATVACFLRKSIFCVIEQNKKFAISRIIKSKQLDPSMYGDLMAS